MAQSSTLHTEADAKNLSAPHKGQIVALINAYAIAISFIFLAFNCVYQIRPPIIGTISFALICVHTFLLAPIRSISKYIRAHATILLTNSNIVWVSFWAFPPNSDIHVAFFATIAYSYLIFDKSNESPRNLHAALAFLMYVIIEFVKFKSQTTPTESEILFCEIIHLVAIPAVLASIIYTLNTYTKIVQKQNDYLQFLANTDPLTGAMTRRLTMERSEYLRNIAARSGQFFSIIILDIDHFKDINDRYGHPVGDFILHAVVQNLKNTLRDVDLLGRIGGEEFMISFIHEKKEDSILVAEKLRIAVSNSSYKPSQEFNIACTVSCGIFSTQKDNVTLHEMISHADEALYAAKRSGRNKYVAFDSLAHNQD